MQTCRMCGARLSDDNELEQHNTSMHPNMSGKKGGEVEMPQDEKRGRDASRDMPID